MLLPKSHHVRHASPRRGMKATRAPGGRSLVHVILVTIQTFMLHAPRPPIVRESPAESLIMITLHLFTQTMRTLPLLSSHTSHRASVHQRATDTRTLIQR
jgi:hypothetical protein